MPARSRHAMRRTATPRATGAPRRSIEMTLNMEKLEPLLHMMVGELGAAANAALVLVGDKLGLYRALSDHGPLSAKALAEKTGTHERYVLSLIHISEPTRRTPISYAVFCLKKKK